MEAKPHQGKTLQYLTIQPDDYEEGKAYPLVILLHGFGANMEDLAGLTPAIDRLGYIYACPNAPIPFQIGPGMTGYGWTPPRGQGTEEDAKRAAEMLGTFFDEVMEQYGVQPGQVVLLGFSQGGSMTYRCGLVNPETFAGLVILSSGTPNIQELKDQLPPQKSQPVFIAHGIYDDVSSVERGREAKAALEEEGYSPQYKEYPMRHEISQDVLNDLIPWIKQVLPPAS